MALSAFVNCANCYDGLCRIYMYIAFLSKWLRHFSHKFHMIDQHEHGPTFRAERERHNRRHLHHSKHHSTSAMSYRN